MNLRTATAWLGISLALLTIGCQEDFEPFSRLTSLRVLAIQSEPAAPGTGETTALTPLVYTPPGDTVEGYQWSWCPFPGPANDGYPCLITEDDLAALGDAAGDVPDFDLGTGETASLEHALDPELLSAVCEGTEGQPQLVDCTEGFPVQIKLVVRTDSEEITAIRRVRLRFAPEHDANTNPTIDGIVAVVEGDEVPVAAGSGPTLARAVETTLRVRVSLEDNVESFDTVDDFGTPVTENERLILSWFTETGDVDAERTSFITGVVDPEVAFENEWEPGTTEDYARDTSEVIIVLRDSRGGVSWLSGQVGLEASP